MASSSSTNYDVFLSFRGTTRNNFTSHLHKALCDNNVKAFIDDRIERGEEITSFLEKIIEGVKLSIIVFSSDYASSTFCLDEMAKILECKDTKAQIVLPIFYKVYPSEAIYEEAFARHEQASKQQSIMERLKSLFWKHYPFRRYEEMISHNMKVERWRSCFRKALELAGWHIDDNRNEATEIKEIAKSVTKRLNSQFEGAMRSTTMVGQTSSDYLGKIMQCLMNDENPRVGVWGMGGVGKTTIVTHIYNILLNDASFSRHIYWVTVSKDSSISKLQGDIAQVIRLDFFGEENESKRAARLFYELKRTNKFVLIFDDVWEAFETREVGIPLMGGGKLLLTTRDHGVCQRMMCQPIEVRPLFKHEAMDLFIKESESQTNDSKEQRELMHSIVEECAGLPLAIVVVARRMRGVKETRSWRNTLRELQKPCEGENKEMEKKVYNPLKFSYDHLPNDRFRQCFLYCSLFPEDHEFRRDDLIEYWIGEQLIDELDSQQAELDKGNAILDELIYSSLLEKNDESYRLKMHDVIRDMAHIIVKDGLQFQDPFESVQLLTGIRIRGSVTWSPHFPKVKTLVLIRHAMELPGCFFANMKSLNVLHLAHITSIPDSIAILENLRVLIIIDCDNVQFPSLAGLEKLRHLNVSKSQYLKEIPKDIERLVNLRVLKLSMNSSLRGSFPIGVIESLSHLQTLDLRESSVEVEPWALMSLQKLEVLRVVFYKMKKLDCYLKSRHWQRLLHYQINYGRWEKNSGRRKAGMYLEAIGDVEECEGKYGIFLPDNIRVLDLVDWESPIVYLLKNQTFADLNAIEINTCKGRYLFTVDFAQRLLHNVKTLSIHGCISLEEVIAKEDEWLDRGNYINYPTIVLPNLIELSLRFLPQLRSIYRGKMMCPSLESIQISECDELERLPFCREKEGDKQHPTIELQGRYVDPYQWNGPVSRRWWDSLQWDDPNVKSMYQQPILSDSEF